MRAWKSWGKSLVVVVAVAGLTAACGNESDEDNALNLNGTWKSACYDEVIGSTTWYIKETGVFADSTTTGYQKTGTWTWDFYAATDTTCASDKQWSLKYNANVKVGDDNAEAAATTEPTAPEGYSKLDFALTSVKMTAQTAAVATAWTTSQTCGVTAWTAGTETDIPSSSSCSARAGATEYWYYSATETQLCLADGDATQDGTTADKRENIAIPAADQATECLTKS